METNEDHLILFSGIKKMQKLLDNSECIIKFYYFIDLLFRKKDLERGNLWEFHQIKNSSGVIAPTLVKQKLPFPKTICSGKNILKEDSDLSKEFLKQKVTYRSSLSLKL
jgi:hypothetical protein